MWQRFTERARHVVFFAQEEAGRLGQNYVSTEHLLLGLTRENDSVAARILDRLGVSLGRVRSELERHVARDNGRPGQDMQLTPRAKRVIDLAYDEARQLNSNNIGTEHLLLGLIREGEGLAGRTLLKLGVDLERARGEAARLQEDKAQGQEAQPSRKEGLLRRTQDVIELLLETNPALALLPDEALLQELAGGNLEQMRNAAKQASDAPGEAAPLIGDLGVLRTTNGRQQAEVATSESALLELAAAVRAKDRHGYQELVSDAKVLLVPTGTEIKRLPFPLDDAAAVDAGGYYIRILNGEHAGKAGWIPCGAFQRIGPDTAPFPPPPAGE